MLWIAELLSAFYGAIGFLACLALFCGRGDQVPYSVVVLGLCVVGFFYPLSGFVFLVLLLFVGVCVQIIRFLRGGWNPHRVEQRKINLIISNAKRARNNLTPENRMALDKSIAVLGDVTESLVFKEEKTLKEQDGLFTNILDRIYANKNARGRTPDSVYQKRYDGIISELEKEKSEMEAAVCKQREYVSFLRTERQNALLFLKKAISQSEELEEIAKQNEFDFKMAKLRREKMTKIRREKMAKLRRP